MKKIFNLFILSLVCAVGCDLDMEPSSAVSPGSVTSQDIVSLRSGMYIKVQENPGEKAYVMFDLFGGNLTTKASKNSIDLINSLSTAMSGEVLAQWQGYYKALMQVNNVYSIAEGMEDSAMRNKVLGECHYFRAYLHLCLVTRFGDVPLMKFNTDDLVSRTPASEVWQFIYDELDLAIGLLGTPDEGCNYLSADAARALKARVCLYTGKKKEAVELAEGLIADARYGLDGFDKIFRAAPNKEVIFSFSCLNTDQSKIAIGAMFYSYNYVNSGSYSYVPAGDVMTMYDDNDLRKDYSITVVDNLNCIHKYPSGQKGTDPVVISRLAEMYLISAEAQGVEKGLTRLNELRQARGLTKVLPGTEAEFVEAILEERRKEFLCEGHRWYDLVRTGKAVEKLGIQQYQTLMPIPAAERQANRNLTQNPGY